MNSIKAVNKTDIALVAALKECANQKNLHRGSILHADILKEGLLESNVFIGSTLVNAYCKCGALAKAQQVFQELAAPNTVCWNALITGYAEHGHGEKALSCFGQMQEYGLSPSAVTCTSILKACSSIGLAEKGNALHDDIVKNDFFGEKLVVSTALMDMYGKCGNLTKAQQMFDELSAQDTVAWNALMAGYAQHGYWEAALNCFQQMKEEGLSPSAATFSCILTACGSIGAIEEGKCIHIELEKRGLLRKNIVLGNALVDMYAQSGALWQAQEVFDRLPVRDVISWTTIIRGYCQHGHGKKALNCFERMQQDERVSPNAVTLLCILQACGSTGAAEKGGEVHVDIVRTELLGKDSALGNALVDMYAKLGALAKAREVFDTLMVRDKVSWTALITAYCEHRYGDEALKCYESMQDEGLSADAITLASILQACGNVGAIEKGKAIHAQILREGLLGNDTVLGTALLDFYANCSLLAKAHQVFDELHDRTVVSWNALIGGYAQAGKHNDVFYLFNRMRRDGIAPDLVTFVVVLSICSYLGLVNKGQMYMETMSKSYGFVPKVEHLTCLVALFGHAGLFDKAIDVIKKTPSLFNSLSVWFALLGACQKWGNVKFARLSFEHTIGLDKRFVAA